jgi:hypothetical protein
VITADPNPSSESRPAARFLAAGTLLLAAVMWCSAVTLPVWEVRSDNYGTWDVVTGALPALIGWLGILARCPAWFANVLLIPLCFTLFKARRKGFWLSVVAFAIAASAYAMHAIYGDNDEGVIVVRRIGFYLWLGSFLVIAVGHALVAEWGSSRARLTSGGIIAMMVAAVLVLERAFPVGVSALEATTKYPEDVSGLANALAQHPSQADKDNTLYWVVVQDVEAHPDRADFPRVRQLIAAGANVNQRDRYGQTLRMRAAGRRADSLVRILVQAGAT